MSWFLERIFADHYGAFHQKGLGSFSKGLNVVYGANEAGKTTMASLVGDVLFGWEKARGVRNTYRPCDGADRSATLVFSDGNQEKFLARTGDDDVLQGDLSLVSDIDQATYRTMFSLTSDELQALRSPSDVTARLLSAGSGTKTSPSSAFVELEQRIAAHTSTAEGAQESVINLGRRLEAKREEVRIATEQVEISKQKGRELLELQENKRDATERFESLTREIEELTAKRVELVSINGSLEDIENKLQSLRQEQETLIGTVSQESFDKRLISLDSATQRALEDKIDEFSEAQEKSRRILDTAKENSAASTAAYEALLEMGQGPKSRGERIRTKTSHAVISIVPSLAFVTAGLPLFIHGRQINSLSFTIFGIALILLAFLLGAVAIFGLLRPSRDEEAALSRQQDAQWVMLQDKKKLDSSMKEQDQLDRRIAVYLEDVGLGAAKGSLRQARIILEEALQEQIRQSTVDQRISAIKMHADTLKEEIDKLQRRRGAIEDELALPGENLLRNLDNLIHTKTTQRAALLEVSDDTNRRIGELTQELEQAKADRTLDHVKREYQEILVHLRKCKHELIELLLAKRMLERSIAFWESRNQPQVYDEASRLFSLITNGKWTSITMSSGGSVVATDCEGRSFKPRYLSCGTCQQLYLALRIALLISAADVGRAIPVLADDILVNFDAERRKTAARALVELARVRQVIVFTCHEETVAALQEATSEYTYLEL